MEGLAEEGPVWTGGAFVNFRYFLFTAGLLSSMPNILLSVLLVTNNTNSVKRMITKLLFKISLKILFNSYFYIAKNFENQGPLI